jgi:hypothetical protein
MHTCCVFVNFFLALGDIQYGFPSLLSFLIFGAQTEQYRHVNQCWQACDGHK